MSRLKPSPGRALSLTVILVAPLALTFGAGVAQGAATADSPPESMGLEEILVTAQRRSERLKDVPGTLSAMSGDALERAGVTSTPDLAAAFPGLVFTGQGPAEEPTIRGVSTSVSTPGGGSAVPIYIDGVYQNSQIGNLFDLPDVQQIQVLKGPQGSLYGRNATGGVILVTTQQPSFTPSGFITVSDGVFFGGSARTSNHFQTQGFVTGQLIGDMLAGSIAAQYENVPGYFTNDLSGRRGGKIESVYVRPKLLFAPVEGLHILLAASYNNQRDDAAQTNFPLYTVAARYPDAVLPKHPWHTTSPLPGGDSWARTIKRDISLAIDWTVPGVGELTARTAYTYVNPLFDADVTGYSPTCLAAVFICITPFLDYSPDKAFQQELTFTSDKFGRFSFVAGAFYLRDKENGFYNINPPLVAPYNQPSGPYGYFVWDEYVATRASAIYLEGTYEITDKLTAVAGVRYSDETATEFARESFTFSAPTAPYRKLPPEGPPTDVAFTPKVALRYALDANDNLFVSYNRGFKSSVLTALSLTAPATKPETIDSFEAGLKHSDDRFSYNASAFFYKYRDLQVETYTGFSFITKNAAAAKSYGFDLDGTAKLTDNFKLQAAVSWIPYAKYSSFPNGVDYSPPVTQNGLRQIAVDATGHRMLKDPEYTANLTADYKRDLGVGIFDASATIYHSACYDWDLLRSQRTESYTTLNGRITVAPRNSGFKYTLYGKNLTNKVYITGVISSAIAAQGFFGPPREVGLRATYSF